MTSENKIKLSPQCFVRFNATLCTLITAGFFCFASNLIYDYDEVTGSLMALTVYVFTYNWFTLHGNALTRARKVFLNVANVLDTYQIFNRKYGHFYESDPDTPGEAAETFKKAAVMSLGDIFNETTSSTSDNSKKFEEAVQKHYAAVYQAVQRSEREMETKAPVVDDIDSRQKTDNLQEIKMMPALSPDNLTTDKSKMER